MIREEVHIPHDTAETHPTGESFSPLACEGFNTTMSADLKRCPTIGVTMGDAAGIGPEIIVKALSDENVRAVCRPIVIGSPDIFREAILRFTPPGTPHPKLNVISRPAHAGVSARSTHGTIDLLPASAISPLEIAIGTIDARAGTAAVNAIETAVQLAMAGELDAITTAPICKAAVHRAGFPYPGHTEMLAALTNTPDVVMMLCTTETFDSHRFSVIGFQLRDVSDRQLTTENERSERTDNYKLNGTPFAVSFVTNHMSLADVTQHLSVERIRDVICLTRQTLIRSGVSEPRLVVAGLNPHAGEGGLFGKEEQQFICPAIAQAQAQSQAQVGTIEGPLPADALFVKAMQGEWHAVIAMYHDQGNIPIKLLGFGELVNVTLGLPIVRTSVDHGTAFDIAGKGLASETSLVAALKCASLLVIQ